MSTNGVHIYIYKWGVSSGWLYVNSFYLERSIVVIWDCPFASLLDMKCSQNQSKMMYDVAKDEGMPYRYIRGIQLVNLSKVT
jgi:hypothetical protein